MYQKSRVPCSLQVLEYLSSNAYIFVPKHSLQLKLSAMNSSASLLSSNMWFCMIIFNPRRVILWYVATIRRLKWAWGWYIFKINRYITIYFKYGSKIAKMWQKPHTHILYIAQCSECFWWVCRKSTSVLA